MADTTGKAVPTTSKDVDAQAAKNKRDADRDKQARDRKNRIRNQVAAIRKTIVVHSKATTEASRALKALTDDAAADLIELNEQLIAAAARRKEAEAKLALARRVAKVQA